jgi:hypothetical protein
MNGIATRSDSAVDIRTGYRLDEQGVGSSTPDGGKNFYFSMSSRPALEPTQPPIQWVLGALSPEVKRSGSQADHSPQISAEVNVGLSLHPLTHMSSRRCA